MRGSKWNEFALSYDLAETMNEQWQTWPKPNSFPDLVAVNGDGCFLNDALPFPPSNQRTPTAWETGHYRACPSKHIITGTEFVVYNRVHSVIVHKPPHKDIHTYTERDRERERHSPQQQKSTKHSAPLHWKSFHNVYFILLFVILVICCWLGNIFSCFIWFEVRMRVVWRTFSTLWAVLIACHCQGAWEHWQPCFLTAKAPRSHNNE